MSALGDPLETVPFATPHLLRHHCRQVYRSQMLERAASASAASELAPALDSVESLAHAAVRAGTWSIVPIALGVARTAERTRV